MKNGDLRELLPYGFGIHHAGAQHYMAPWGGRGMRAMVAMLPCCGWLHVDEAAGYMACSHLPCRHGAHIATPQFATLAMLPCCHAAAVALPLLCPGATAAAAISRWNVPVHFPQQAWPAPIVHWWRISLPMATSRWASGAVVEGAEAVAIDLGSQCPLS